MMPAAPGMMVSRILSAFRRTLVRVSLEVTSHFRGDWNAFDSLGRMRSAAGPQHEDKHQSANKGGPAVHRGSPSSAGRCWE